MITIGIDPHKASLTAVAVDQTGVLFGEVRLAVTGQVGDRLLAFAAGWSDLRWAVEGASGLGRGVALALAAAGETVLDVPAKLAARARLLATGHGRKTDSVDAASVAAVAQRHTGLQPVHAPRTARSSCGCSPTTAMTWSPSGLARSTGCTACCAS